MEMLSVCWTGAFMVMLTQCQRGKPSAMLLKQKLTISLGNVIIKVISSPPFHGEKDY